MLKVLITYFADIRKQSLCLVAVFLILCPLRMAFPASILVLGNSITAHGPSESLGWNGNWGMAASSEKLDFVHRLGSKISAKRGGNTTLSIVSAGEIEGGFFSNASTSINNIKDKFDYVILEIGDNIHPNSSQKSQFYSQYSRVVGQIKDKVAIGGQLVCVGKWWASHPIEEEMMRACLENSGKFVSLIPIASKPGAKASSERKIENDGVAGHPGDKAMEEIADAIFCALFEKECH